MKHPRLPMDPSNWSPDHWRMWKQFDNDFRELYSPEMQREAKQLRKWYKEAKKYF